MKRAFLASALALSVAFLPSLSSAQQRGGGGMRGGGGGSRGGGGWHAGGGGRHGGGGHAVPRSGQGQAPRGGAAYVRHPRAGTGAYAYYGGGHPGGYKGGYYGGYKGHGHYGAYYPYYRPYYAGYRPYYAPYYSPWYGSFNWGWPYYGGSGLAIGVSYGPAYVSGAYSSPPGYSVGTPERAPTPNSDRQPEVEGDWGRVRLEVRPEDASVYVDDRFLGTGREARSLRLTPGPHVIELVRPGFAVERRELEVVEGESVDVLVELRPAGRPPA